MEAEISMLPALRATYTLFRGVSLLECAALVLTAAAFVFLYRRQLAETLRAGKLGTRIPLGPIRKVGERVAARCRAFHASLLRTRHEAEVCLENRMAQLDRLIVEADREILRLQSLLPVEKRASDGITLARRAFAVGPDFQSADSPREAVPMAELVEASALNQEQRTMVRDLVQAGHSLESIGGLVRQPAAVIQAILSEPQSDGYANAA